MICLPTSLTNLAEDKNTDTSDPIDSLGEHQNPLYKFQCNSQESLLISNATTSEEICIAPGEGKNPLVADDNCKLLASPYLFPKREFGCDIQGDIKLSPVSFSTA